MDLELGKTGGGCLGENCLWVQAAGAQLACGEEVDGYWGKTELRAAAHELRFAYARGKLRRFGKITSYLYAGKLIPF